MAHLPFSESSNKTGMYEVFNRLTKTNSSSYDAYKYATDANMALNDYFMLAIQASGRWQVDDTNQTDYPELKINLVSGQFDYPFTVDASSTPNQVLSIERVEMCTDNSGNADKFIELPTYDEIAETDGSIVQKRGVSGVSVQYSKKANGIFLDPTPDYSCTNGLRVFFSRTPSYFAGTDTTKEAGIPHAHRNYLIFRPAYNYCVVNLPELAKGYLIEVTKLEQQIKDYYSFRNRDERVVATSKGITFR